MSMISYFGLVGQILGELKVKVLIYWLFDLPWQMHIIYIMEENTEDFQEMLNIMKVQEFKEAKQQKRLTKIFSHLKKGSSQKAELFYKNTIYAKVLNAFMIARLQSIQYNNRLSIFYEQLQNTYLKMQLQTHFQAMKQFKNIRQKERDQKTKMVIQQRKKSQLKCFSNIMRHILFKKLQKKKVQAHITPIKEAYKTDSLFNKQRLGSNVRNDFKQPITKQNFYRRQLEQSRNSAKSAYSLNSQLGARRKFAVVKQLPKFPQLQEIQEKYPLKVEQQQKQVLRQPVHTQIKKVQQEKIATSRVSIINKQQACEKSQEEQRPSVKKYNKDNIIATICKIKMLEISQLNEIINQYSSTLKYESLISQKAYLSQSIATLQKLIKL